jgi:DNA (cytosine-5)-methyltransferase 1
MPTYYEFFAGGGMVRAGLGKDWHCLLANDLSEKKARSYAENWGGDEFVTGDIHDLSVADIPGHADLAWGSFPCQDLSLAGTGAGLDGHRSSAFWGFWSIIHKLNQEARKPRMVMLENVYGVLTSHGGKDIDAIAQALASEGYLFGVLVIDAIHFVPQSRPRVFIYGVDAAMQIPDSAHAWIANPAWHPAAVIRAHNRLPRKIQSNWRWWNPSTPEVVPPALEGLIEVEPQGVDWHCVAETAKLLASMSDVNRRKVAAAQADGKLRVGTVYRRTRDGVVRAEVRFDGISGCLRTPTGGSSRQTIIVVQGKRLRSRLLSPREAARLMGLPDDYQLPQRYNDAYHLAGDGVVVPVVNHLTKNLFEPLLSERRSAAGLRLVA